MHNCKICQKFYIVGERASLHDLCLECWISKFNIEPLTAQKLRSGEYLHQNNCDECKRVNRAYCPECVE